MYPPSRASVVFASNRGSGVQKHILIADDHMGMRQVVKQTLSAALDIDYQEAANGREAIKRAEQTRPDLIILDISMPEMDGITAAKHLKQHLPEIPIILFTMYELGQDGAKALGVDAVVSKSEGLEKLSNCAQSLLSR